MMQFFIGFLYVAALLCAISGVDRNSPPNLLIFAGFALLAGAILHAKEREIEEKNK